MLGMIWIFSVDYRQEITVSTNKVYTELLAPLLPICPEIVVVYTPATVGVEYVIVRIVASNVINAVD